MSNMAPSKYVLGIFKDEGKILKATSDLRDHGVNVFDVFTPYPIHGMDDAMGIKRSRLPIVCFIAGSIGFLTALLFQLWVFGVDWPIIVGGKPMAPVPAMIPVTFEFTVLVGGLVTVGAFFWRSRLFPGAKPKILDIRATDDCFVLAIEKKDASIDYNELEEALMALGAEEVRESEALA